jgi:hypothetical protein
MAADGTRLDVPLEVNLFETGADEARTVVGPLDPEEVGVDPLTLLA